MCFSGRAMDHAWEPVRTLGGVNSPVTAPTWAGPSPLIGGHRDGRVRASGIPARAVL
ncbi:hypothetical protein SNL152K_1102 [Streptomyces sp. NL15-2K]|nr:hypothetical protein SNL152K_1102 [Streptomyces sp. NL15-2K]